MATNFRGFGNVSVLTDDNKVLPIGATIFTLTSETTNTDILTRPLVGCGNQAVADVTEDSEVFTLTVGAQKVDREQVDFLALGARRESRASITLPVIPTTAIIPSDGLVVVPAMDIDQTVAATILSDTAPGNIHLTQQPNGTGVTATTHEARAGVVAVDTAYANSQIMLWYQEESTNILGIGGNLAINKYRQISVFGKLCGNIAGESNIFIPKAINTSGVNLNTTVDDLSKAFRLVIDTANGWQAEYFLW